MLRVTLELIGEGGVANVSNRNVARAAGVSLGALTYHFDSQATLLRESLDLFITEETERLAVLTNQLTTATVSEEQAALALEAMLGQEPERRVAKLELYLQATRDPALREAALRCFSAYDALAASALSALGLANPQQIAPIMVAIIDGLQLRRLASGEDHLRIAEPLTTMLGAIKAQAQSDPGQPPATNPH